MEFNYIEDGIDAVVIDNFYSDWQLKYIWKELDWLTKPAILKDESALFSAQDYNTGEFMTKKIGVFLENVFIQHHHSALISCSIDNMKTKEFRDKLLSFNSMWKTLFHCDARSHLLSYYENSSYYKPHRDACVFTILNYFHREPKKFEGGEIILHSHDDKRKATLECKNNRVVIIPSCTLHEVNPIVSSFSDTYSGDGRYCFTAFVSVVTEPDTKKEEKK